MAMTRTIIQLSKRQNRLVDGVLATFGCLPPNLQFECVVNEKVVVVKFTQANIKQLLQNGAHTKVKLLSGLCNQLARCVGIAKCNETETFDADKGTRLAKLKFTKNVAGIVIGCHKQLIRDNIKKFENLKNDVNREVTNINNIITKYKDS